MKEPKVGDQCPDHLAKSALSLIKGRTPKSWADRLGPASPPLSMDGLNWVQDLQQRYSFLDKLLKETTPVVNLGSFLYPQAYCSIFKQVWCVCVCVCVCVHVYMCACVCVCVPACV